MNRSLPCLVFALFLAFSAGVLAQTAGSDAQKRQVIEQKIRLVESLANSPAAQKNAPGLDAETGRLLERGRSAIEAARGALAAGRSDEAAKLTDDALRAVSAASRRISAGAALSDSAQRKDFHDLSDQVAAYRASLVEMSKDAKSGVAARDILARLDVQTARARQLEGKGYLGDATRTMAAAYKFVVEEIARLRQGQVLVQSLDFATPADEFAYEQRRFTSNEILVAAQIADGKAEGERRAAIDQLLGESRRLKHDAEGEANAARYKEAVVLMEKANTQLVRALQMLGVPIY